MFLGTLPSMDTEVLVGMLGVIAMVGFLIFAVRIISRGLYVARRGISNWWRGRRRAVGEQSEHWTLAELKDGAPGALWLTDEAWGTRSADASASIQPYSYGSPDDQRAFEAPTDAWPPDRPSQPRSDARPPAVHGSSRSESHHTEGPAGGKAPSRSGFMSSLTVAANVAGIIAALATVLALIVSMR